jgi:hypothetical protein
MYYPKSQIKPNLYTEGTEFVYKATNQPYSGYYYKISTGRYFTGKNPDDKPNLELITLTGEDNLTPTVTAIANNISTIAIPVDGLYEGNEFGPNAPINETTILNYAQLTNTPTIQPPQFISPVYNAPVPTEQDYQIGEFRRYFCKKTNAILYLEINKDTFDRLVARDPQYVWSLYQPFNLPWQLTGVQEEVERTNRNIVALTSQRLKLPEFGRYLKDDYLKYYK